MRLDILFQGDDATAEKEAFTAKNGAFQIDCLALMQRIKGESVDLVYLDPPWYPSINRARHSPDDASVDVGALAEYMSWMGQVVQEVRRILTPTGSLFLHSVARAPTNYKLLLDQVFGQNYVEEFIWPSGLGRQVQSRPAPHDVIFMYGKTDHCKYHPPTRPLTEQEIGDRFVQRDERGRFRLVDMTRPVSNPALQFEWRGQRPPPGRSWRYTRTKLEEMERQGRIAYHSDDPTSAHGSKPVPPREKSYFSPGATVEIDTIWDDIANRFFARELRIDRSREQKPIALLERIIAIGSDPADLVLDPFMGTGTSLVVAQNAQRRWLGGDSSDTAFRLTLARLQESCGLRLNVDFKAEDQHFVEANWPVISNTYAPILTGLERPGMHLRGANRAYARFSLNGIVQIEEDRHYEFKEIRGSNPVATIRSTADEYAVAYLNSDGGSIFWGIRDDRSVAGVRLDSRQRDELRRTVSEKLAAIQPPLDPTSYSIELHPVYIGSGSAVEPDLYVVEIAVPAPEHEGNLYCTGGQQVWVRMDGAKRKLTIPEILEWVRRRPPPTP